MFGHCIIEWAISVCSLEVVIKLKDLQFTFTALVELFSSIPESIIASARQWGNTQSGFWVTHYGLVTLSTRLGKHPHPAAPHRGGGGGTGGQV
jgi:hypothetical protein